MGWEPWEVAVARREGWRGADELAAMLMRDPSETAKWARPRGAVRRCGMCEWHGDAGTCGVDVEGAAHLGIAWAGTHAWRGSHACHIGLMP